MESRLILAIKLLFVSDLPDPDLFFQFRIWLELDPSKKRSDQAGSWFQYIKTFVLLT